MIYLVASLRAEAALVRNDGGRYMTRSGDCFVPTGLAICTAFNSPLIANRDEVGVKQSPQVSINNQLVIANRPDFVGSMKQPLTPDLLDLLNLREIFKTPHSPETSETGSHP